MGYPHLVIARLYEYIEPIDRGNRYEDPLQAALEAAQAGAVTGGGSQLNEVGGIEFADVEIELANLDAAIDLVANTLEGAGAPQGSEIRHEDNVVLRERFRKDLDGDVAFEACIASAVHLAHAAFAKGRPDFIDANAGAAGEAHEGLDCIRILLTQLRPGTCRSRSVSPTR